MPECPICGREYEGRFQVFVPPHYETCSVVCAQRAAEIWAIDPTGPSAIVFPTIEAAAARSTTKAAPSPSRRTQSHRSSGQAAFVTGLVLLVGGGATAIYLGTRSDDTAAQSSVGTRPAATTRSTPPAAGARPAPPRAKTPSTRPGAPSPAPATRPVRAHSAAGKLRPIQAGVSYRADSLAVALRMTVPDGNWGGGQWQTGTASRSRFGWAAVGRLPLADPRGLLTIETAFGPTPSAAAIVARLRSAGAGATFGKTTRARVAGLPALQVDGSVSAATGHVFVPFSPRGAGARAPDAYAITAWERFRIIVLDVGGSRLVVFLESFGLPARQFPAFLGEADTILGSLEFSG